jgi:hypothetical protein
MLTGRPTFGRARACCRDASSLCNARATWKKTALRMLLDRISARTDTSAHIVT